MIKTLKKFSKKSLAILIALLMIISVMPFTPPISVEAADKTAADYQTEIDTIFAEIGTTGYTAKNPEAADKSYSSSTTFGGGDEMSNVLYTYGVGGDAAHITNSSARIDGGAQYGPVVFLYDGGKMAVPVQFYGQKTHATSYRYLESALPTNAGYSMAHNWHNSTNKSPGYHSGTDKTFAYSDSNPEKKSANVETDYVAYFSNTLYFTGTLDDSTPYRSDYITWKWYWSGYNTLVYTKYKTGNSTFTLDNNADNVAKSGNPSINIVNYMPIKNILSTVKTDYETVKENVASNPNYYTETSLTNYYKLVYNVVSLNPNSYDYASNPAGKAEEAGKAISAAAKAYTKTGLVRQYGVTFVKKDKTSTTKYYAANTAANAVTKPANTATTKKDDTSHYTYSWPNVSAVTADATYEEVENTVNHSFTTYTSNNNATCTTDGTKTAKCDHCDATDTITDTGSTLGHNYTSVVTAPTCTAQGYTTHTCSRCGDTYKDTYIDATGHTEVIDEAVAPTCTKTGLTQGKHCSVCNTVIVAQETVKALGHNYEAVVTAPTCTAQGYTTYTCSRCNDTYVADYVPAKNHTEAAPVEENRHEATCTEDGSYDSVVYCTVCKAELSRETKTIKKLGHSFTKYTQTVAPTCTTVGTETATCDRCDATDTQNIEINPNNHNYGEWVDNKDGSTHTKTCSYNNEHKVIEEHSIENGECTKCHYVAKVKITFVDKDGKSTSAEYAIGDTVAIPKLPATEYNYNGDGATHTVVTYAWNSEPQTTAQTEATYTVTSTTSNSVDCTFTRTNSDIKDGNITKDEFTCSVCGGVMYKVVADKTALNAAIDALQSDLDLPEAGYKYDATRVAAAKDLIVKANAIDRYADQKLVVDAMTSKLKTAKTELNAEENLAKYNLNFKILNYSENNAVIAEYTSEFENRAYGTTVDFDKYVIPTINDDTSLSGLPQYAVYKWVKIVDDKEQKLNTTDIKISDVVKSDATYICYLMNFKATDDTKKETRVRYLDKSGHTIDFDTATVGKPYTRKDKSIAPLIPYYECKGWELVFGDETNVGTRELVYRAIYDFNENEANRCTIIGLDGVYVNGTTGEPGYPAYYDEKIQLTGADKFAYANADGSIIAPINENYIFAPHLNGKKTIYITKVETPITEAKSIITGVFTTKEDSTYNYLVINAQYYLPEGAKAVEAGAVIGKQNDANVLNIGSALKVVSDKQGENHEYSLQMSYSKNKSGTLYARSYLIYVDSKGDTHTVYSDISECVLN